MVSTNNSRLGDCNLGKTLGEGGQGKVKLGTHVDSGERFAVKILTKDYQNAKLMDFIKALKTEAVAMHALDHDNIVPMYEYHEHAVWTKKSGN